MSRQFYNLPQPQELGLKWKPFEKGRQKVERVEARRREADTAASDLERRIREEQNADVRRLAENILKGEDDPAASTDALEDLTGELREQRRLKEASDQALSQAEEELRLTIFEHQGVWKSQADEALAQAVEAEREAYEQARQIAESARRKRLYAESLALWVRAPQANFNVPADAVISTTTQQTWGGDLERAQRQMHERQRHEELVLQEQRQQGGAA